MKIMISLVVFCVGMSIATSSLAVTNLLINPGFLDTDVPPDGALGDGWGALGEAGFNNFFGAPHASLFADDAFNEGFVFQQGITGTPGTTYQFDMINTRIESGFDADLQFGIEFWDAGDTTKIGETIVTIDTGARLANGSINGNVFSMQATAPVGAVFAQPIMFFDNVNPTYVGPMNDVSAFVFNSFLSEVPAPGGELLKNPSFEDLDGNGFQGDYWGSYGSAGFNAFFGPEENPDGHASLFSDNTGTFGGVFQQSILGSPGTTYEFSLTDVRIEENVDANYRFGLEYFGADDFNKIGETIVPLDTNTGQIDGNVFVTSGTAPAGTVYVRPMVLFDDVRQADFDSDDDVDGKDFLTWQRGFGVGTTRAEGDANTNGNVDSNDLAAWETQCGSTNASSQKNLFIFDVSLVELPVFLAASATVPEPSSVTLGLIAALALAGRGRRVDEALGRIT